MKRAVVDQSGLKVVIVGLILSLFVGLIFKSQIRSSVVKVRLQQTLLKLQKDVNIDFESVDVRLSDWGLPRPVVEIRGVRISPLQPNCQDNQVFIDSMTFPLSYNLLFSEVKTISTVRIALMEIRTKNTDGCFSKPTHTTLAETNSPVAINNSPQNLQESLRKSKSHLNELKIDRLRLLPLDKMNTAVDFNAVQILFKYQDHKINDVNVQAQALAFRDPVKNYYLLKSELKININFENNQDEKTKIHFNSEINGLIVDRPFQLKVKSDAERKSILVLGELDNISLKAINYMVKTENKKAEVFDFLSGSSISGYLTGEYNLETKDYDLNLKNMKVLFGGGIAEMSEVHFAGIDTLKVKPFDIQLNHIDLTKILTHPIFKDISPSIQNAGFISGQIQVNDFNQFKIKSLIEKTSFFFSNKGQRVGQTFDSFNLFLSVDNQKISLNINDFILDSEKIKGFIKYEEKNNQNSNSIKNLTVEMQGHLLKPETVELFTGVSNQPEIRLQFSTDFTNNLKGLAEMNQLSIYQFELEKINLNFEKNIITKNETYNLKTGNVAVVYSENNSNQLNPFFDQGILQKPKSTFQQSKTTIHKNGGSQYDFNIKMDQKTSEILAVGIYNAESQFSGKVNVKKSTAKNQSLNYLLTGTLDQLLLKQTP